MTLNGIAIESTAAQAFGWECEDDAHADAGKLIRKVNDWFGLWLQNTALTRAVVAHWLTTRRAEDLLAYRPYASEFSRAVRALGLIEA